MFTNTYYNYMPQESVHPRLKSAILALTKPMMIPAAARTGANLLSRFNFCEALVILNTIPRNMNAGKTQMSEFPRVAPAKAKTQLTSLTFNAACVITESAVSVTVLYALLVRFLT